MFNNKKLLITGGIRSFGNAVQVRFLNIIIKELHIFSSDAKMQETCNMNIKRNTRKEAGILSFT